MKIPALPLLLAAFALIAADHDTGEAALAKELRGRVAAAPVNCIDPHDVVNTRILPGTAIVYDTGGGLYVNRPAGVERLHWDDVLVQRIEGAQLCRLDTIQLLDPVTRGQRGFLVLGPFQAYQKPR